MIGLPLIILIVAALFTQVTKQDLNLASSSVSTIRPSMVFSPSPEVKPQDSTLPQSSAVTGYIYPNSNVLISSPKETVLLSYDAPDSISNWYRQKIEESGFSSKNFIQTNSNGFVENKISGQADDKYVSVDIQKSPNETASRITIIES